MQEEKHQAVVAPRVAYVLVARQYPHGYPKGAFQLEFIADAEAEIASRFTRVFGDHGRPIKCDNGWVPDPMANEAQDLPRNWSSTPPYIWMRGELDLGDPRPHMPEEFRRGANGLLTRTYI